MPIPALTDNGYLPAGIHDCTLEELAVRFGQFQRTDARPRLMRGLETFLRDATATGFFVAVIVDGSFVTGVDAPNDIDMILVLKTGHDFKALTRPFEYNVLSRKQVRRLYRLDMLAGEVGSIELDRHVRLFSRVRSSVDIRKGMVRVFL